MDQKNSPPRISAAGLLGPDLVLLKLALFFKPLQKVRQREFFYQESDPEWTSDPRLALPIHAVLYNSVSAILKVRK